MFPESLGPILPRLTCTDNKIGASGLCSQGFSESWTHQQVVLCLGGSCFTSQLINRFVIIDPNIFYRIPALKRKPQTPWKSSLPTSFLHTFILQPDSSPHISLLPRVHPSSVKHGPLPSSDCCHGNEWDNVMTALCTLLGIVKKKTSFAQQTFLGLGHSCSYHSVKPTKWYLMTDLQWLLFKKFLFYF